jgi:hypothetical protein
MTNKKVLVFLPDGIGLRNFVFGAFKKSILENELSISYWNNTMYPINEKLGVEEIKIKNAKNHFFSDIIKRAKKEIELNTSFKKTSNEAYFSYKFSASGVGLKNKLKLFLVHILISIHKKEKSIKKLFGLIAKFERKTNYYKESLEILKKEKPAFLFCTNQRPILAVAPMLAAKYLGIPTAVFIFSWDNLPKGMLVVEADYYFVWSTYMKKELLYYYPHILENQIKVTGSPQFEPHFIKHTTKKTDFFKQYNLDLTKKYILFSGDDITTSPYDQYYLEDLAQVVSKINIEQDDSLRIIYRKCPVDFSDRHLEIIKEYKNLITCIDPLWENLGNGWNTVMPQQADSTLLSDTIRYSELVVNVGSSMVFDAVSHNIPCAYINYNTANGDSSKWNIEKIYKYIHFKSMPRKEAVLWVNKKEDYFKIIENVLLGKINLDSTKEWFSKINEHPVDASDMLCKTMNAIVFDNQINI